MQISSINYTPAVAPVSAAPMQPADKMSEAPSAADSVTFESSAMENSGASEQAPVVQSDSREAGALHVLEDIFSQAGFESPAPAADTGAGSGGPAVLAADERVVGGFYLADGSPAVGEGIASSLETSEAVPSRGDVADYKLIDHDAAVADYNENVKSHLNFVERSCIKAYCTVGYKLMNGYMLGLNGSPTGAVRMACKCVTKALGRFDVPSGSVLYRTANINELRNYVVPEDFEKFRKIDEGGHTEELARILDARLTGTETRRKSFISTTIDDKFNFEDKPKVATRMYVGENVHGVYVAADSRLSPLPEEKEFLLAPDTKVTVLGVDYDAKNNGMVMHVLLGDLPKS